MAAKIGKGTSEADQLFKATQSGDVEKVREILEHGKCNVNCTDSTGWTPLHWACQKGHVDVVRVLVSEFKANMTIWTLYGKTPLMLSAEHGHANVVHVLLSDSQCLVDAKGQDGYTALQYSCRYGHVDIVRTLVKHKANVNDKTDIGHTPLTLAAKYNHDNVVHALLCDSQCRVNAKGQDGYTALHYSCIYGNVDIARTLVKHNANVNARTDSGDTPLTLAAMNRHDNVVHALSDYDCEVLAKDKDAYTALLHSSCERGYVGIVMALLTDHKADVNYRIHSGDTLIILAAICKQEPIVHALLSDSGCLVDAKNQDGYTALHYSCKYGHIDIVKTLVKHKANVNARTDSGNTPLTLATRNKHDSVVHALLSDSQCLVDAKGQDGYTALEYSCRYGLVDITRTLVKHKADVNARTDSGDTPLTLAAEHGHDNVVHALLSDSQCLVDAKGQDGSTALQYSCIYGHVDIVRTLVKHKANVNARTDSGNTPLTLAAMNKHDNVVHALSDYNCEVLAKDKDAYNALLHFSCERGYVGIVRTLVTERKADICAITNSGDTPLHVAARYGQFHVTMALIYEFNCDINVKGQLGRSLLHSACSSLWFDNSIVEYVGRYLSPLLVDDDGNTPLHIACLSYCKDSPILTTLLKYNPPLYW